MRIVEVFSRIERHAVASWVLILTLSVAGFATAVVARQTVRKGGDPDAAKIKNPVAATPESIAAGKKIYSEYCAGCHGTEAQGDVIVSITEDRGLPPPPALADDTWDHGSSDGEIFTVLMQGVAPDYIMGPWKGRLKDEELWNVINYLRSVSQKK
jgi:mono/diheme cytochrome c family protein